MESIEARPLPASSAAFSSARRNRLPAMLREAIEVGLLSRRLAMCLLLVDPWNPVFSQRRLALLRHVPEHGLQVQVPVGDVH